MMTEAIDKFIERKGHEQSIGGTLSFIGWRLHNIGVQLERIAKSLERMEGKQNVR